MARQSALCLLTTMLVLTTPAALADGDAKRGQQLYQVCAACHGDDARGNADTQAPQLAGQFDWYLIRQLQSFKNGSRGTGVGDVYGAVMKPMADALKDDQDVEDVVAYILSKKPTHHR